MVLITKSAFASSIFGWGDLIDETLNSSHLHYFVFDCVWDMIDQGKEDSKVALWLSAELDYMELDTAGGIVERIVVLEFDAGVGKDYGLSTNLHLDVDLCSFATYYYLETSNRY